MCAQDGVSCTVIQEHITVAEFTWKPFDTYVYNLHCVQDYNSSSHTVQSNMQFFCTSVQNYSLHMEFYDA